MAGIVGVKAFNKAKLAADKAVGGVLDTSGVTKPSVHLFTNALVFSPTTKIADLTEATFVGYSAVNVTGWDGPSHDVANSDWFINADGVMTFQAGAILADETAYGWYMLDPAGALVMGETFAVPALFHANGDTVILVPKIYEGLFNGPPAYED